MIKMEAKDEVSFKLKEVANSRGNQLTCDYIIFPHFNQLPRTLADR